MEYTKERVMELARIAHIAIREEDAEGYAAELSAMHVLADVLQDVPYREDPFSGAVSLEELREDHPAPCLLRDEVLKMAPAVADGCVVVPRVVEA